MNKKITRQCAFFSARIITGFALSVVGLVMAFGAAKGLPPTQSGEGERALAPGNVQVFQGIPAPLPSSGAPAVAITPAAENEIVIDMAALNIHPTAAPLSVRNLSSAAVGKVASFSISPEIGNQNTTRAFAMVGANFMAGENVQVFFNGSLAGTFPADADGRVALGLTTGAGSGFIAVDEIGVTSGRETGGAVQVAPTGPYLPGFAAAPHAINPTGSSTITARVVGFFPAGTPITFRRNGVSIATATSDANGGGIFVLNVPAATDGSAVYSVDSGAAGSMAGATIEERSDAGTPPMGDQNAARAFVDRAVVDSAVGGTVAVVGEGFIPGETVTTSGCTAGSSPADSNGASAVFFGVPAGAAIYPCTLTGGTSGRVARATIMANPLVTNIRGMIVAPAFVTPGGTVTVLADKLPPNDTGAVFLDGVNKGTAITDASGTGVFTLTKPTTGFVHSVAWVPSNNNLVEATGLLLGPSPTPPPTPTPPPGYCPSAMTQSSSQVITNNNSVSCGISQNSYWRAFGLAPPSIADDYNVTSVDIGIQRALHGSGPTTQPVTVNLYKETSGSFPSGTRVLVSSTTTNVADQSLTILNIPITGTIPSGTSQLVVEINTLGGGNPNGDGFIIGSNAAPESGPSYLSAPDCNYPTPVTTASINNPNMHIVLNVHGSCPAPATLTVTKTADTNDGVCNADCSLREALAVAGSDGAPDLILFSIPANSAGCTGSNCTITLTSPLAPAADGGKPTTIDGITGPNTITLSGNGSAELLDVGNGVRISAFSLNFTGGGSGAAFLNTGGTLTLTNSALYANTANNGGAFFANSGSVLNLTNVTISGNSTTSFGSGGGIWNAGGAVTAINCTISNNSARQDGGAATFNGGTFTMANTIIAGNTTSVANPDVLGSFTSQGHNLIGKSDGSSGFTNGSNGDQVGTIAAPLNPQLALLANNGGKTRTQALQAGSPAINAGNDLLAPARDQRGFPRNGVSDIGAYEYGPPLSLKLSSITHPDPGNIILRGFGLANTAHTIEVSSDLTSGFSYLTTVTSDGAGSIYFDDTGVTGVTKRFYRLTFP